MLLVELLAQTWNYWPEPEGKIRWLSEANGWTAVAPSQHAAGGPKRSRQLTKNKATYKFGITVLLACRATATVDQGLKKPAASG
jgi:hypothetical protein